MASFMAGLPPCPENLKPLQHYLKLGKELEAREPVVAYWARYQAVQHGILLDSKSSDAKKFLMSLMDLLERSKKNMPDNDAIRNNMVAQAYLESFAIKLFKWADDQDRSGVQNPNVVKAFYQAAVLFDVVEGIAKEQKEALSEDNEKLRKYARWKATYIQKCLRSGDKPLSGPIDEQGNPMPTIGNYNSNGINNTNVGGFGFGNYSDYKPDHPPRSHIPTSNSNDPMLNNPALFPGGANPITSYPDLNDRGSARGETPPPPPRGNQSRDSSINNNMSKSMYTSNTSGGAGNMPSSYPSGPAAASTPTSYSSGGGPNNASSSLPPDLLNKAQKMIKFAGSSLTYDDMPSTINYLEKALAILKSGRDVE